MSGGPVAIRGYLVQTFAALLDALDADTDWLTVTLEPNHVSEKIDILWQYPGRTKAVQVKSSINPFEDADVKQWARDLETSRDADEYELRLVGTPSKPAVARARSLGKVGVPSPQPLDLTDFKQRAAHMLERFLLAPVRISPPQVKPGLFPVLGRGGRTVPSAQRRAIENRREEPHAIFRRQ